MSTKRYTNIAIIKYWCKDKFTPYLIPLVPSISLLSTKLYTETKIEKNNKDEFYINNIFQNEFETKKIFDFIDKVIPNRKIKIKVNSYNNMPTAAGLASSASGIMALVGELNQFFKLNLDNNEICKIATMGSGSAGRSLYKICAFDKNGEIYSLNSDINFKMIAIIVSDKKKKISSREAMKISKETSLIINKWVEYNTKYFNEMKLALEKNDFNKVGELMELSTNLMFEVMKTSKPTINYLEQESIEIIEYIKKIREENKIEIYYTTDAGPNVKVLFQEKDSKIIEKILNEKYKGKLIDVI